MQNARDELTADREIGSKSETSGSALSKPDATAYSASFGRKSRESDVEEIVKYVERERSRSAGMATGEVVAIRSWSEYLVVC